MAKPLAKLVSMLESIVNCFNIFGFPEQREGPPTMAKPNDEVKGDSNLAGED
jgi:hypothetical protein